MRARMLINYRKREVHGIDRNVPQNDDELFIIYCGVLAALLVGCVGYRDARATMAPSLWSLIARRPLERVSPLTLVCARVTSFKAVAAAQSRRGHSSHQSWKA